MKRYGYNTLAVFVLLAGKRLRDVCMLYGSPIHFCYILPTYYRYVCNAAAVIVDFLFRIL